VNVHVVREFEQRGFEVGGPVHATAVCGWWRSYVVWIVFQVDLFMMAFPCPADLAGHRGAYVPHLQAWLNLTASDVFDPHEAMPPELLEQGASPTLQGRFAEGALRLMAHHAAAGFEYDFVVVACMDQAGTAACPSCSAGATTALWHGCCTLTRQCR
jgi:hypothetical protein